MLCFMKYKDAKRKGGLGHLSYFNKNKDSLKFVDKELDFYQTKISLFEKFIKAKKLFQIRK